MCFHTSVDKVEAGNFLPGNYAANSSLAKSGPLAPPQSEDAGGAGHLQEGVLSPFPVAGVVGGSREPLSESEVLGELADGELPGVAVELAWRWHVAPT